MFLRFRTVLSVFRSAFENPVLRRVGFAYALFGAAEFGIWITLLVFAYGHGGPNASLLIVLVPVSYTHLDVYKRQQRSDAVGSRTEESLRRQVSAIFLTKDLARRVETAEEKLVSCHGQVGTENGLAPDQRLGNSHHRWLLPPTPQTTEVSR